MAQTRIAPLAAAALAAALTTGAITPASAQTAATPKLDDAQIAHVAVTANAVDIELAALVVKRTGNKPVRDFAEMMIRDHTGVNAQAAALAKRLGVTPKTNDVSTSLRAGGTAAQAKLSGLKGAAYDRAYMDREIAYHQAVIDAVDGVLVPQTSNAELRKLLVDVRPALVAHLSHAKTVRAGLK